MIQSLTYKKIKELLRENKISIKEILQEMKIISDRNKHLNIFITDLFDQAIENANNKQILPFAIKDNFYLKGTKTTSGSRMLKDFESPFTSTIIERLSNFCAFVGKTNQDEFACGSSGKTSYFGETISPWKNNKGEYMSPGGSSSGSAAAVTAGVAIASIGTDTGGSVRQPAAWSGLFGFKPTYGALSRYGIVDFSSFLDCPSLFTKTVEDCKDIFYSIIGKDINDFTSINIEKQPLKKKIGIFINDQIDLETIKNIESAKEILSKKGYDFVDINIPFIEYSIQLYYIIAASDLSSNLSRYNGIFYGDSSQKYENIFNDLRTKCFGKEVQRRILLGNYITYVGNMNDYFDKARQILYLMNEELKKIFIECDAIILPTVSGAGMTLEEARDPDPIKMYLCDLYTCFVNLLGLPGANIPVNLNSKTQTPMGIQVISKPMGENLIFDIAEILDQEWNFHENYLSKLKI